MKDVAFEKGRRFFFPITPAANTSGRKEGSKGRTMEEITRLGSQFFAAEGAAADGSTGEGAAPGVETAAPGQSGEAAERPNAPQEEKERDGEKLPREESASAGKSALAALSRKDPALKQELESLIRKRVRSFAQARDSLKTLQPALELMASCYGQKTEKGLDYAALASAVQKQHAPHRPPDLQYERQLGRVRVRRRAQGQG